jgi:hypothetical protein
MKAKGPFSEYATGRKQAHDLITLRDPDNETDWTALGGWTRWCLCDLVIQRNALLKALKNLVGAPMIGYVGYDDPAHCENCKAVVAGREIISYVEREIGESPENGKRGNHVAL